MIVHVLDDDDDDRDANLVLRLNPQGRLQTDAPQ